MSTFCIVYRLDASVSEDVRALLTAQATPANMDEFRTRASMVPHEIEDMSLKIIGRDEEGTTDSIFFIYVGASKPHMTLEDFYNGLKPYRSQWSDWWNSRYLNVMKNCSQQWLLVNNSKDVLYAACTASKRQVKDTRVHMDLVLTCDSQAAEQFSALYAQLQEKGSLREAWRRWSEEVGLVCRVVMIAKASGRGNEPGGRLVLGIRSKYVSRTHKYTIEAGLPVFTQKSQDQNELTVWMDRHTSLVNSCCSDGVNVHVKDFAPLFEMYREQPCYEHGYIK